MLVVLWLFLSSFMVLSLDMLSFGVKRTGWYRFASTFFLFYSQVVVTEFLLGVTGVLTSLNLVVLNIAISSLVLFVLNKKMASGIFKRYLQDLKNMSSYMWQALKKDRLWRYFVALATLLLAWVVFLGIIFPATDFDGNSYHLTFIGYAIQNHNIFDVPTSLGWLTGYPKGGEFIEMWNVIIANNDMMVDLAQIPFLLLGIYALYEISKKLGVKSNEARFASLLFLFIPVVLNQLKTTYIDVMLCALFFAAIAMVIKKKLNRLDLVITGIVFSLLISIKFTGFLFVAATLPLLIWNLYKNQSRPAKSRIKKYSSQLSLVFLPTIFGLYWYIKNYVLYNNPLYPFGLKLFGLPIFPGKTFQDLAANATSSLAPLPRGCFSRIWFVWTEQRDWYGCFYNYDSNFTGLGPIWFVILIPAFVVSLYFAIRNRNYLYAIITIGIAAIFTVYPINYYSRYTMFIVAVGIFALGIVLTNIGSRLNKLVKSFALILAMVVVGTNFTFCNFPPSVVWSQLKVIKGHGNIRSTAFESAIGGAYVFIENRLKPDEVVAYDSAPYFIYPLWKPDYSNKVLYIAAQNKAEWFRLARYNNVKYFFADIGSKEYGWVVSDSGAVSIYKDGQYEIFQIN